MPEDVTILSPGDRERWEAETQRSGLPSQSWSYALALRPSGIEPRLAIVRSGESRMLLPFFERSFLGTTDIATLPGLSGASIQSNSSAPLSLWHEYATAQGWVCGYIQLAIDVELEQPPAHSEVVAHNAVFVLDLQAPDMFRTFSRTLRRKIRDALGSGAVLVEDPGAIAESLKRLYPTLDSAYPFSPETLDHWAHDPASLGFGARIGDEIEAVFLARVAGRHAEFPLAATTKRGRALSTWMYWSAIMRLQQMGVHSFNIGGGGRVGDGIYQYKLRFNVTPTPLRSVRQIYDGRQYDELCERTGVVNHGTWFPAYRAEFSPSGSDGS